MNNKHKVNCPVSDSIIQQHNRGARERALLAILARRGHPAALTPKAAAALIRGRDSYSASTPQAQVARTLIRAGVRARKLGPGRTNKWVVSLTEVARALAAGKGGAP